MGAENRRLQCGTWLGRHGASGRYNVHQFATGTQALSLEHWESFYRKGPIATFPAAPDGGYDLGVRNAWVEFFAMLPDGARVLDVGTGNGAVALIATETAAARGRRWEIHATDLARIDPAAHVRDGKRRMAGITFHPGVATERLPFEAESFDAVAGQYALEHTDTLASLREIHRVMKPGSDAQFILHGEDSVHAGLVRQSMDEAGLILIATKVFRRLHAVVSLEQAVPGATQRAADNLRAAIHALKKALLPAQERGGGELLGATLGLVQKLLRERQESGPEAAGLAVDQAETAFRFEVRRMKDIVDHACSAEDLARIEQQAADAGFSLIERLPQYLSSKQLAGWQLLLHRA
jgi:ubiquinone/menaquinone biosynthesis C-methylase UbiE